MTFRRLTILGAVGAAALLIGCGIVFATRPGPGAAAAALVGMLGGVLVLSVVAGVTLGLRLGVPAEEQAEQARTPAPPGAARVEEWGWTGIVGRDLLKDSPVRRSYQREIVAEQTAMAGFTAVVGAIWSEPEPLWWIPGDDDDPGWLQPKAVAGDIAATNSPDAYRLALRIRGARSHRYVALAPPSTEGPS